MNTRSAANGDPGLVRAWYEGRWWLYGFLPLSWLFQFIARIRRRYLQSKQAAPTIPVIVVGNIALGGTGKTPLLIDLVKQLRARGFKTGVISRGHGSRAPHYPFVVNAGDDAAVVGDEPLLIANNTGCPVVIDGDRRRALATLTEMGDCDLVLSDDGLQHYKLARSLEIVVIDGSRGLGNGLCLPAGPLRESPARLKEVDWVVVNGLPSARLREDLEKASLIRPPVSMNLHVSGLRRVLDDAEYSLEQFTTEMDGNIKLHAMAGIGNPGRFFKTLEGLGLPHEAHVFPDHYRYSLDDIRFGDERPVIMTEKDAVKVRALLDGGDSPTSSANKERYWYLPVTAQLPDQFIEQLIKKINLHSPHSATH